LELQGHLHCGARCHTTPLSPIQQDDYSTDVGKQIPIERFNISGRDCGTFADALLDRTERGLGADGEHRDRRLARVRAPVATEPQRIGRGGHRFEADQVLAGRGEDLRRPISLFEVHFEASAAAGHGEYRCVGHLVVGVVKGGRAELF
jgi:hypothetical protein